ncbi:basic salivary proline-rich protein 2-like [Mustela putorius furo]|uniref:Basic salivary proline-rich protein 2-like n=1 Tax=Mustela putorius furo TaxID=9669 RepID=A0A8U0S2D4_MUSPF|nr:basic salivary proline-rich protein 2-like [Mustela putorius furo]
MSGFFSASNSAPAGRKTLERTGGCALAPPAAPRLGGGRSVRSRRARTARPARLDRAEPPRRRSRPRFHPVCKGGPGSSSSNPTSRAGQGSSWHVFRRDGCEKAACGSPTEEHLLLDERNWTEFSRARVPPPEHPLPSRASTRVHEESRRGRAFTTPLGTSQRKDGAPDAGCDTGPATFTGGVPDAATQTLDAGSREEAPRLPRSPGSRPPRGRAAAVSRRAPGAEKRPDRGARGSGHAPPHAPRVLPPRVSAPSLQGPEPLPSLSRAARVLSGRGCLPEHEGRRELPPARVRCARRRARLHSQFPGRRRGRAPERRVSPDRAQRLPSGPSRASEVWRTDPGGARESGSSPAPGRALRLPGCASRPRRCDLAGLHATTARGNGILTPSRGASRSEPRRPTGFSKLPGTPGGAGGHRAEGEPARRGPSVRAQGRPTPSPATPRKRPPPARGTASAPPPPVGGDRAPQATRRVGAARAAGPEPGTPRRLVERRGRRPKSGPGASGPRAAPPRTAPQQAGGRATPTPIPAARERRGPPGLERPPPPPSGPAPDAARGCARSIVGRAADAGLSGSHAEPRGPRRPPVRDRQAVRERPELRTLRTRVPRACGRPRASERATRVPEPSPPRANPRNQRPPGGAAAAGSSRVRPLGARAGG